jgi:hypothetical protein
MSLADQGANGLDIGVKNPPGLIVGVTDIIARYRLL